MARKYKSGVAKYVKQVKTECYSISCDRCGREFRQSERHWTPELDRFFSVTTSHSDWGNDSGDSITHYDVCLDCLPEFVSDFYKNEEPSSLTAHIEIEADYFRPGQATYTYQED